jgi:hypothetical protein
MRVSPKWSAFLILSTQTSIRVLVFPPTLNSSSLSESTKQHYVKSSLHIMKLLIIKISSSSSDLIWQLF